MGDLVLSRWCQRQQRSQGYSGEENNYEIKGSIPSMDHVIFNNSNRKILAPHRLLCFVIKMISNRPTDIKPAYTHPPSE